MCMVCRQYPCHPRCPNADEPRTEHMCKECGNPIYEGEKYLETFKGDICKECLDDMSIETILYEVGEELHTA